jgi:hypothetical protein
MISGQTHCRNGHRFTPQNTKWRRGTRICLVCAALRQAKAKEARKCNRDRTRHEALNHLTREVEAAGLYDKVYIPEQ